MHQHRLLLFAHCNQKPWENFFQLEQPQQHLLLLFYFGCLLALSSFSCCIQIILLSFSLSLSLDAGFFSHSAYDSGTRGACNQLFHPYTSKLLHLMHLFCCLCELFRRSHLDSVHVWYDVYNPVCCTEPWLCMGMPGTEPMCDKRNTRSIIFRMFTLFVIIYPQTLASEQRATWRRRSAAATATQAMAMKYNSRYRTSILHRLHSDNMFSNILNIVNYFDKLLLTVHPFWVYQST